MAKATKNERELPEKGRCKIEFLAAKDVIKTQIEEGWPAKTIWAGMSENGTFSGGYRNFVKLVNSLILGLTTSRQSDLKDAVTSKAKLGGEPALSTPNSSKRADQSSEREPKKISAFEPPKVGGLGAKDANKIQDDLV